MLNFEITSHSTTEDSDISKENQAILLYCLQKTHSILLKPQFYVEQQEEKLSPRHYYSSEQREIHKITYCDGSFF